METTTKKRSAFLSTPLNAVTSLTQIPGVGTATLEKLTKAGISTPSQLLGQFMLLNKSPEAMSDWLRLACNIRQREGSAMAEALFAKTIRMEVL
jgi:nucleotidyltransferase/DNA polymerase involved in DNA repair